MKFSSLTLTLLFVCLFFVAFSVSTDETNVKKVQKTANLKVATNLKAAKSLTKTVAKTQAKIQVAKTQVTAATTKKVQAKVATKSVKVFKTEVKSKSHARTHADPALYISALTDPAWKYQGPESKKDYSKMEKVQSNRRVEQAQNMNNLFFTNGHSASVAKLISAFLGDTFKTEAKAAYTAFQKGTSLAASDISQGFADNNWKIFGTLDDLGALNFGIYHGQGKNGSMTESEFVYMMIDTVFAYNINYDCKNCLQSSRKEIKNFFNFLDCDTKGFVYAMNLYDVLKQMTGSDNLKTTDVNEWLLKEDHRGIGRLDSKQLAEGILKTLYELTYLD